jgi:hypothetical protein
MHLPTPTHQLSFRAAPLSLRLLAAAIVTVLIAACGGAPVDDAQLPTPIPTFAAFVAPEATATPLPTPVPPPTVTPLPAPEVPALDEAEPEAEEPIVEEPVVEEPIVEDDAVGEEAVEPEADPADPALDPATEADATPEPDATPDALTDEADLPDDEAVDDIVADEDALEEDADVDTDVEIAPDAELDADTEDADIIEETEVEDVDTEAAAVVEPSVRFLQPTDSAIVPLTFTVNALVESVTLQQYPFPTDEAVDDATEAEIDEPEADDTEIDEPEADALDEAATEEGADVEATDAEVTDETDVEEQEIDTTGEGELAADPDADADATPEAGIETPDAGAAAVEQADALLDETAEALDEAAIDEAAIDEATAEDIVAEEEAVLDETDGDAHYLFVLVNLPFLEEGEAIPAGDPFIVPVEPDGSAQLSLMPGTYRLRLQLANADFEAQAADESAAITVWVSEDAPAQSVRFVMPTDGATVPPEFDVQMAATGLTVEPIGEIRPDAGHFHILIDAPFVEPGEVIPADETNLHYGAGQLTTTLSLEPGIYTLRLQMADGVHTALEGEQYQDELTIVVSEDAPRRQIMFVEPQAGAVVTTTFPVSWAAAGLIIEPIGPVLDEGRGHLHLLIDEEFVEPDEVIPTTDSHRHFGGGQLATELTLEPGDYTLRLQMANGAHIALEGDDYRDEIAITVVADEAADETALDEAETDTVETEESDEETDE